MPYGLDMGHRDFNPARSLLPDPPTHWLNRTKRNLVAVVSYSLAKLLLCHGPPDKIALRLIALPSQQKAQLFVGLNTLGNHLDIQSVRHRNDGSHDGGRI